MTVCSQKSVAMSCIMAREHQLFCMYVSVSIQTSCGVFVVHLLASLPSDANCAVLTSHTFPFQKRFLCFPLSATSNKLARARRRSSTHFDSPTEPRVTLLIELPLDVSHGLSDTQALVMSSHESHSHYASALSLHCSSLFAQKS